MKRQLGLSNFFHEIAHLAQHSPMTESLAGLIREIDFCQIRSGENRTLINYLRVPIVAATDPWAEIEYQSIYIRGNNPEDRIVLQEPTVRDPMVLVVVLKAARLSGESGMVYCGNPEKLKEFAQKLPEYEKRGTELDEKEFLECLIEAAEADGLRVVFHRLSYEHGGEEFVEEYDE